MRGTDILSKTVKLSEEIKEPGTSGESRTEINEEAYGETQTKDSEENEKLYEADYEVDDEAVVSIGKFIAPDQHASLADKLIFVREHQIQPFNANRVYSRQLPDGNIQLTESVHLCQELCVTKGICMIELLNMKRVICMKLQVTFIYE